MKTLRQKVKDFIFTIEDRTQEANVNEILSIIAMKVSKLRKRKFIIQVMNEEYDTASTYNQAINDAVGLIIGKK